MCDFLMVALQLNVKKQKQLLRDVFKTADAFTSKSIVCTLDLLSKDQLQLGMFSKVFCWIYQRIQNPIKQPSQVFCKIKGVVINFEKFKVKHLCQHLFCRTPSQLSITELSCENCYGLLTISSNSSIMDVSQGFTYAS